MRAYPRSLRLLLWLTLAPLPGFSQPVQLQPGSLLLAGGTNLDLGDYAIPCVADWNGDGLNDLIVGYRYADKIAIFYNIGSAAAPVFNTYSNLQAGGVDIVHPSVGCGAPAPFVCDFDNDGKRDLLVGTGLEGYVYFYRNTNSDSAPLLAPGVLLMVGNSPLAVPARATPYFCDWDGDGLKDLLCGDGNGFVNFFRNVGTAESPVFAPALQLQAGGTPLNLGPRSIVRLCDWDGDGRPDLLGSSAYGVYWCKNIVSTFPPVLLAPVALLAPVPSGGLLPINTGPRMRLDVVDWNNDSSPDLIIGNYDGTISYFERYRFAFTETSTLAANQLALRWNSAPFLRYNVLAGPNPAAITNLVITNLSSAGRSTACTNPAVGTPSFFRLQIAP